MNLKKIYSSANEEEALDELEAFGEIWDSKYPMIRKSWESHWDDLNEFFSYPEEIRKSIGLGEAIPCNWNREIRPWKNHA